VLGGNGSPLGSQVTSGTPVNGLATATYTLPAYTPVASYMLLASYTPGTGYLASSGSSTLTITQASQSIAFVNPGPQTMGTAVPALTANSSSGLAVNFSSATPTVCTVSAATVTLLAPGTCTIDANQAGNSNYAAAPTVAQSFNVTAPPAATPLFTLPAGRYTSTEQVGISDSTAGVTIYYTTNGTTPTTSSTIYSGPITVYSTETLQAIAVGPNNSSSAVASATYTLVLTATAPVISPSGGNYTTIQSVTLADYTTGAAIYYTVNGTTPTTSSTLYTGPITVSSSEIIEAIAVASGYSNSTVTAMKYTINLPAAATPTFSVAAGTYATTQTVALSDTTPNTMIYYTTNGATPTTSSTLYTGPIAVSSTETLQAIAVATGYSNSAVATATYTINPGAFACHVVYTISPQNSSTFGASIAIEDTGTAPISNWTLTWSFADGQTVTQLWNGNASQQGATVTVTNMSYNGSIPAGGIYTGMGFNGTWNGVTNNAPTSFAINGTTCN
jgi:hypothetical protein